MQTDFDTGACGKPHELLIKSMSAQRAGCGRDWQGEPPHPRTVRISLFHPSCDRRLAAPETEPSAVSAGPCFAVFFLFSFWSLWFWALWLASPTLRGKAAGEESCRLPLEDGEGGEEHRAKPEQLGSPVWAGGPGCPRGAHCPATLGAEERIRPSADERAPSYRLGFVSTAGPGPGCHSDCLIVAGLSPALDKVGRLFLIDPSNHNLSKPECGFHIFFLLLQSRMQGWGPSFSG